MAIKPSRTLTATKLGLYATLALSLLPMTALILSKESLDGIVEVTSTLAIAIATIATGGTVAIGGRHWGSKEQSSFRKKDSVVSDPNA